MTWFSVFLVNVLLTGAVLFFLVRHIERRIQPTVVLDQIRTEVNELIVEFNQTTDRNVALIEERIGRLNQMIEKADRRVAVLRREIDSHQAGSRIYSDIVQSSPGNARGREQTRSGVTTAADPVADVSAVDRPTSATSMPNGTPAGATPAGSTTSDAQDGESGTKQIPGAKGNPPGSDRRSQILDLHEKGIAANIIAARVGTTVSEVELIVSLTQRKR